ncbi:MAG: winged helix-turn-helix transcriptional regulator [Caulobacteraceae bacterium]|nr:winged helix-turn-helix transcriptional regulator [Caulobacter sp.]
MPKASKLTVAALERSPSHLLHQALQFALDVYGDETGGADAPLTQRQFAVLAAVEAHPAPTQTDLVRATGVDRSTLADMIARLLARDLLARERSTLDARANVVRLTEAGREALDAMRPRAAQADARILKALGSGKRDGFVSALRALARAGEASLLDADADAAKAEKKARKAAAKADGSKKDKAKKKAKRRSRTDGEAAEPAAEA